MSARNADLGTVLTAAALGRVRRVAGTMPDPDRLYSATWTEDEALTALGDRWVEVACAVQLITKDPQHTQQVLTDALNRATREAHREP